MIPRYCSTIWGILRYWRQGEDGIVYGFGRDGEKIRITPDTRSVYAFQGGQPFLELAGGICPGWSMILGQRRFFCPWIREQRSTI